MADRALVWILRGLAAVAGAIAVLIVVFLVLESAPVLRSVGLLRFFSDDSWHPASGLYGLTPMLWGTLFATAGAVLVATPLGILSALFSRWYAPPAIRVLHRRMIEVLAGIPSVVYGFWGLIVLVPLLARIRPPGTSLLAGIVVLSIMILPTIALTSEAAFASVPEHDLRAAASLGLSRWSTLWSVVFPHARSGLFTGVILGTARAIGETMAILMVAGSVVRTPDSLFAPIRTLTANIALEMAYATGDHRSALFVCGLLLLALIGVLAVAADLTATKARVHDAS